MKFLLTNPEVLIRERNSESSYGKVRSIRLGMGSEYDNNAYSLINTAIETFHQDNSQPLDLAEAFLYSPRSQGSEAVRDQLRKFFDIIETEKAENGETIVHIEYIPVKEFENMPPERKNQINARYFKLEKKIAQLGLKPYTKEQLELLTKGILDRYTQDLQERGSIDCEDDRENLGFGEGYRFCLEDRVYVVNGEEFIVKTKFSSSAHLSPENNPGCTVPKDHSSIYIEISRFAENNDGETLLDTEQSFNTFYYTHFLLVQYGNVHYKRELLCNGRYSDKPYYYIINTQTGESVSTTEEGFNQYTAQQVIQPQYIDIIHGLVADKARFYPHSEKSEQPRKQSPSFGHSREVSDWPDGNAPVYLDIITLLAGASAATQEPEATAM